MHLKTLYHNCSFWVKYLLSITIIVTKILAAINIELLFYNVWLYSSILFLLLVIISTHEMLTLLKIALCLVNIKKKSLEENLKTLAEKMGADFTTYYPVKNYNSALVFLNQYLVIGESLRLKLSKGELEATLAHEFSHKIRQSYHDKVLCVGLIFNLLLLLIACRGPVYMIMVMIPALLYFLAPFFWCKELDCDETAIKYSNKVDLIKALSIVYEGRLDAFSLTHPSVNYRIKNLNRAN